MIGLRLLRVALGPSFLDPLEEHAEAQLAARTNKEKGARLRDAETQMLNYVGLGANPHGDLGGGDEGTESIAGIGTVSNPKAGPTIITGAFHISQSLLVWNMTRIRAQLQVYTAPGIWQLYGSLNPSSPRNYIGLGYVFGYDLVRQVAGSISHVAFGSSLPAGHKWFEEMFAWVAAYPLLEKAVSYMLGVGSASPPLPDMYSGSYFMANWKLVLAFAVWRAIDNVVQGFVSSRLRRVVGPTSPYYPAQFVRGFFLSVLSNGLCEILTLPITTVVYHMVASKYHMARPLEINALALLQAVVMEWFSTWSLVELHQIIMYLFYYR